MHAGRWRFCLVGGFCLIFCSPAMGRQLIERVEAHVNGYAITLTDVRAAAALGVIDAPEGADPDARATDQLIERQLVLAEVARFAPPEPDAALVAREAAAIVAAAGPRLAAVMASMGIDEARIRDTARDNLRIEAYLDQRFGATAQLTEEEVAQYYRIHPDEFTRNGTLAPFADVEPLARQRASAERRAMSVAQWVRDLRMRADIRLPKR